MADTKGAITAISKPTKMKYIVHEIQDLIM